MSSSRLTENIVMMSIQKDSTTLKLKISATLDCRGADLCLRVLGCGHYWLYGKNVFVSFSAGLLTCFNTSFGENNLNAMNACFERFVYGIYYWVDQILWPLCRYKIVLKDSKPS